MRVVWKIAQAAVLVFLCSSDLLAQNPTLDQGTNPYSSLHGGDVDSVLLQNGNLLLQVPLLSYPQRGDLQLGFFIAYDNHQILSNKNCESYCTTNWYIQGGGVHIMTNLPWVTDSTYGTTSEYYAASTPDGAVHRMGTTASGLFSLDATGFQYNTTTQVLIDRQGIRYSGALTANFGLPTKVEDPNGNFITSSTESLTDSLGRSIPLPPMFYYNGSSATTDYSNCSGSLPTSAAYLWTPPGFAGGSLTFKVCYASVSIAFSPSPGCTPANHCYPVNGNGTLIQSIVLPNNTTYTFEYDPQGNLAQLTLPTGGTISYSWYNYIIVTSYGVALKSRTVTDQTGAHQWTYSATNLLVPDPEVVTATDPVGNQAVHTFTNYGGGPSPESAYETQAQYYQGSSSGGTLLKTTTTAYSWTAGGSYAVYASNVVPTTVTTSWPNGKVSRIQKAYDSGIPLTGGYSGNVILGQVIEEQDFDYGSALLREIDTTYQATSGSAYLSNNLLDLPSSVLISDGGGNHRGNTTYGYDETTPASSGITTQHDAAPPGGNTRGNQTSIHRQLIVGGAVATSSCATSVSTGGYLVSNITFFDTGMVDVSKDPCVYSTSYAYSSTYAGAYRTKVTNAKTQSSTFQYDFNTGLMTSTTDPNSQTTNFTYDNMWRLATVSYPDGGLGSITHQESTFPFTATLTKSITGTENYVSTNVFDALGRISETLLSSDSPSTTYTVVTYDALGRKSTVYNPTRCNPPTSNCGESTWGYATYAYDGLSRVTQVTQPDGSIIGTSDTGNSTTVTDEAGRKRTSVTDGLGRLVQVFEDPSGFNYETDYQYDALDDLTSVVQSGSRSRSFAYDSTKRLTSSTNPESGAIAYTYDADGNVLTKVDARPTTTTYSFDSLNRLVSKSYSDSTPPVEYFYDGNSPSPCSTGVSSYGLAIGRRTAMCDGAGFEAWTYNDVSGTGWQIADKRNTNSVTERTVSQADLAGSPATLTYPSARIITYAYNGAGRPTSAQDVANGTSYATSASYAPPGELNLLDLGASLKLTSIFNSRSQPCWIYATTGTALPSSSLCTSSATTGNIIDLKYSMALGTADNGNVVGITNDRYSNRSQSFGYDSMNRILTATTTATHATDPTDCWGEGYVYDNQATGGGAWGNLTNINVASTGYNGCTQEMLSVVANTANQINGMSYDAAGNMTSNGSSSYIYNAENQLVSTAGVTYKYDGDGKRVSKSNGKIYWYGGGSDPIAETDASGNTTDEYIFFGSQRVARRDSSGNVVYYMADHLGTSRLVTSASGSILDESDFYPFGGERVISVSSGNTYKFTGKERDTESTDDYFGIRYFGSSVGRFMSPDSIANDWDLANPQTWNRYVYAWNDPLKYLDPDGAAVELIGATDEERKKALAALETAIGNKVAADSLYINEVKDGDQTRYFVGISGDIGDFEKLSGGAKDLGELVGAKQVVEFGVVNNDLPGNGKGQGSYTYAPGEIGNANPRVLINPSAVASASSFFQDTIFGQSRFGPGTIRDTTTGIAAFHEFGHVWGMWQNINAANSGVIPGASGIDPRSNTSNEALRWENRMRQQVYGPLGSNNAERKVHD